MYILIANFMLKKQNLIAFYFFYDKINIGGAVS